MRQKDHIIAQKCKAENSLKAGKGGLVESYKSAYGYASEERI